MSEGTTPDCRSVRVGQGLSPVHLAHTPWPHGGYSLAHPSTASWKFLRMFGTLQRA